MIALGHVALLRPWWLAGLPLVALLFALSKPRGGALASWENAADAHLLAAMVARGAATGGRVRAPAILATLCLGFVALAGPAIQRTSQDRLRNLDATLIAIDVGSDMSGPGAIREAASTAHDLLQHIGARQAGLIVYGGDAYVASALTDFTGGIDADLFALDDQTVPDPGVRPDRALALAGKTLEEAHILSGDVVLISGGGGLEGQATARAAGALEAAGHRVYVVAATPTGTTMNARSAAALQGVADAGGGFVVPLSDTSRLGAALADEAIHRTGNSLVNALDWQDFGRWLLAFAAIPLLLGFRRAATT